MTIVCNTSPISNLAVIGQLDLLRQVYGAIVIPHAVAHEVAKLGSSCSQAAMLPTLPWVEIKELTFRDAVDDLLRQQKLDLGEAEAIILAISLNANLLIIDEQLGRNVAKQKGLEITGLLGALLEAKSKGIILQVKPIVDDLVGRAKFRVSTDLYRKILTLADESSFNP
ncbi:DUF3368 domain-containing protein [Leptolyngbya sp. CCNP1308]|uniref:DUF3368 domain-containing protein n=1 Tax=Leptolyngbya sp. CCNP1308 TaxID=3110255 RepID=UPI002B210B35|nr:DUF3368 domain-containing protein [Leptolyngbya sp. CCNP1308]MEA5449823.1 DUF3368 domain-containing protein [Leptolyngbya sp. CCNP1308]